ncbi:MAG TPA: hypothetical protein VGN64_13650 [Dyadobacter sp.]|jgi:hypothetical protein|nr:hypothetical protein [Dyadobacter sp.]
MTINPDRTMFKVGGIVYDKEGKYIILNYHMPHVQRDGQHLLHPYQLLLQMQICHHQLENKSLSPKRDLLKKWDCLSIQTTQILLFLPN